MTMLDQRQKVRREPVKVELKKPKRRIGYGWMIWVLAIVVAAGAGVGLGFLLFDEEAAVVTETVVPFNEQAYLESLATQGVIPAAALEPAVPDSLMAISGSEKDLLELLVRRGVVAPEVVNWELVTTKALVNQGLIPEAALAPAPASLPYSSHWYSFPEYFGQLAAPWYTPESFDFSPELFDHYEVELWRHVGLISFGPLAEFDFSTFDYFETKVWAEAGMSVPDGLVTNFPEMPDPGAAPDPVAPGEVINL